MLKDLQYKYKTLVLNSEQMKKLSKDEKLLYKLELAEFKKQKKI
jgi:hypothetical protein